MASRKTNPIDHQFSLVYEELRRLAYRLKEHDGSVTLNPTALVHEAYMQLAKADAFQAESPLHLKNTVIRVMRRLLVDAARHRATACRGGGLTILSATGLDNVSEGPSSFDAEQVVAINLALDKLAQENSLQASIFECHFFGGLPQAEIAGMLELSEKSVRTKLRLARAWLLLELYGDHQPGGERE